jgi:hypothetical protein
MKKANGKSSNLRDASLAGQVIAVELDAPSRAHKRSAID